MSAGAPRDVMSRVEALGVVPVVEVEDAASAVPLARALADGGLPVLEVTFRTPAARDAVAAIAAELPDVLVGAGTLLTADMVRQAADAGAAFGVSPGVSRGCLDAAAELGLPFVPGAVTPSELMTCLDAGVRRVKFFPAGAYGGLTTLTALAGPFAATGVRFVPTGGVNEANVVEYLSSPVVAAVGGTWLAPRGDISAGRWDDIRDRARAVRALTADLGRVAP